MREKTGYKPSRRQSEVPADTAQSWLRGFLAKIFPSLLKPNHKKGLLEAVPKRSRSSTTREVAQEKPSRNRTSPQNRPSRRRDTTPPAPAEPDPDFPLISTTAELEAAVAQFSALDRIALDTEADSLHCYFDKLCLIQITIPGKNLLIDPLAEGLSLSPLFQALEGKTLIIHSADYDLRLLRRHGFTGPTVLFDTMIAARLCGATEFGLAALLNQHFGVSLAKASQKANWAIRPLPREMLEYAVNDTANLAELAQIQEARLRELGRLGWFQQMCERQIRQSSVCKEKDPDSLWRIAGYADLTPRGMAILRALWNWRDSEARNADRPSFHILNNDQLLDTAARFDKGAPVDPKHIKGSRKTRFLEAAEAALQLPESDWPKMIRKPRLRTTPEQENRFRELKKHRDTVAENLHLDPTLIAAKATLEQLSRNETAALESLLPWQRECLPL